MNEKAKQALLRAKSLLNISEPEMDNLIAFDAVVAEARAYLAANQDIPDGVDIEISFSKNDFKVGFGKK